MVAKSELQSCLTTGEALLFLAAGISRENRRAIEYSLPEYDHIELIVCLKKKDLIVRVVSKIDREFDIAYEKTELAPWFGNLFIDKLLAFENLLKKTKNE